MLTYGGLLYHAMMCSTFPLIILFVFGGLFLDGSCMDLWSHNDMTHRFGKRAGKFNTDTNTETKNDL